MKVLIDFDDVLSDTFTELERREGPASDFSVEDLRVMFPGIDLRPYFEDLEFHMEIPPVPGASEGMHWIIAAGHDVQYASARLPSVEEVSREWLEKWGFPLVPLRCLGREGKKEMLGYDEYDLLLDDQMRYLNVARERGKRAVALDRRWNGSWNGERIASWAEIEHAF
jgi:hypothetical protein